MNKEEKGRGGGRVVGNSKKRQDDTKDLKFNRVPKVRDYCSGTNKIREEGQDVSRNCTKKYDFIS